MATTEALVTVCCSECAAEQAAPKRLPTGWKRIGETVTCVDCWKKRFALRAVTMRVAKPDGIGWPELRKLLRESFTASTQAANWVLRQMALHDPGFNENGKLAKMPQVEPDGQSLYLGVMARWSDWDTRTASCIVQAAQAKYKACRFKMARGEVSLPSIRYPHPIPCHNATWSISEGEDGGLVLDAPLGRKNRVRLVLRGGSQYRRQLNDVRRIIKGEVQQCQLDIYEEGTYPNTKQLVKMVGWFPRQERTGSFAASLVTGPVARPNVDADGQIAGAQIATPAFLTLYNDERRTIYRWNADHVRGWIAAQDERMQRLREDLKAEKRLGRERDGILAQMDRLERDHYHRLHSFCHEVSTQVVEHLRRRHCGTLMFVDKDRSYFQHFPWAKLAGMLADKAHRAGIDFIASGDAGAETP